MFLVRYDKTPIKDVLFIKFDRYIDDRGYFTEKLRISDLDFIPNLKIVQANESKSSANTIRGLHFQWEPYMGKLVRSLHGSFFDLIVDIRIGSPTFGKGIILKLSRDLSSKSDSMVWLPPGIAHGFFCDKECVIEYFCTEEYNQDTEDNISPLADDIDWAASTPKYYDLFKEIQKSAVITDKDRNGNTIEEWTHNQNSKNFIYEELKG